MKHWFLLIIIIPLLAFSQEKAAFYLSIENASIQSIFSILEEQHNIRFSYKDDIIQQQNISVHINYTSFEDILDFISEHTNLKFEILNERYVIVLKKSKSITQLTTLNNVMVFSYLARGIKKTKNAIYSISPKTLGILPGLTDLDILESIQQLPGVISPNETVSDLIVRGGIQDQNHIIWDGINIYHKGNLFGMISPFNPNVVQHISFINKGTPSKYGERISSVIDITTKNAQSKTLKAAIGANAISTDAVLELPIIKEKLSAQASLRRSYTNFYKSYTFDKMAKKVFEGTQLETTQKNNNDFTFLDYNLKLNYTFNANNQFRFSLINIKNNLDYKSQYTEINATYKDILEIKNYGYSLEWDKIWNAHITQHTSAFRSKYKFNYNLLSTFEGDDTTSDFNKKNIIYDSGISTEFNIKTDTSNQFTFGYQFNAKDVSYAFLYTDDSFYVLDTDRTKVITHSLYGSYRYTSNSYFDMDLGFRSSYYDYLDRMVFEPRLMLYAPIISNLKLQASAELKNQIISEIDETIYSDFSLENKLWRLANGNDYPLIKGHQFSLGFIYKHKGLLIEVDGYTKQSKNISALALGFLNSEDNTVHLGTQKVFGVDVLLKKDFNRLKTWVSYSFTDMMNKYDGINNGDYFLSNTGIKHQFTTSLTYKLNDFQIALGWKIHSGKPYTQAITTSSGLVFNKLNAKTLDNFHRMDISSTYDFKLIKPYNINAKAGFSIRNVYDQKNHISREYEGNNGIFLPIRTIDRYAIRFSPNVFFRVYL
ncbi:MAG: TonB-dependent receptor [Flavobacteriaceae bacterium]|nr:TonB-dependent receptor [Flavobacteriaceae bacterium]